jgi:hypothetical protein
MKNTKYKEGYIPKIQHWTGELIKASTPLKQIKAINKINYFKKKHQQEYGGEIVSIAELMVVDSKLSAVTHFSDEEKAEKARRFFEESIHGVPFDWKSLSKRVR